MKFKIGDIVKIVNYGGNSTKCCGIITERKKQDRVVYTLLANNKKHDFYYSRSSRWWILDGNVIESNQIINMSERRRNYIYY